MNRATANANNLGGDLLYVAEGDPESWNSWSGCSRSLLSALRSGGVDVASLSADLSSAADAVVKAVSFAPSRSRWINRYHASTVGHSLRSHKVRERLNEIAARSPVLQAGASFSAFVGDRPLYAICDANAAFASSAGMNGPLAALTSRQLRRVIETERRVYERCSLIFAFTEKLRRSFIEDFSVPASSVFTTFQGANLADPPSALDVQMAKKHDAPRILFVGRMFERKGGDTVVQAFRQVRRQHPNARLQIVGCSPDLGSEPGIEVLGLLSRQPDARPSLREVYLQADLFCLPTRYEPFGTSFVEAMLHGVPCIGSREWSSEVIAHESDGWLVGAGNEAELAEVLVNALADRIRLREMGLRARARATDLFSWDRVAGIIQGQLRRQE